MTPDAYRPTGRRATRVLVAVAVSAFAMATHSTAATIHVPADHSKIQHAIDAASPGDTVVVEAGIYRERLRLKEGVVLQSAGDDSPGKLGLKRAESTIINGDFEGAQGAGVTMALRATLDGFTVTGVGQYDDALWRKHHATLGEEQPHEHIGAAGTAGISVIGIEHCTVTNNIVHHIGYTGIAITGAKGIRVAPLILRNVSYRNMGGGIGSMRQSAAIIQENVCFQNYYAGIGHNHASPTVVNNTCYENIRAGIGISEDSCPLVRGNKCYKNRRAGIGIRSGEGTQPIVEGNECYENEMAGIGNREEARPVIRHNRCFRNKMAGIGSRDGARAVIEFNDCFENRMSGIGTRLDAAPVIRDNRCYRNAMAGIGIREGARPVVIDNECFENKMAGIGTQDGAAPILRNNRCYKNEMAGIGARLASLPIIADNECFENKMAGIGSREGAAAVICGNRVHDNAMAGIGSRRGARPIIVNNIAVKNQMAGIGVRGATTVATIVGNRCLENRLVAIGVPDGATAYIHGNELKRTGGGAPPLVAVKGGSRGFLSDNRLSGGGVAGLLAQGQVSAIGNHFQGAGGKQGSAVWVWKDSSVLVADNRFAGYRNALNASDSSVTATGNVVRDFSGPTVIVKQPLSPPHVYGNTAIADEPTAHPVVEVEGAKSSLSSNVFSKKRSDVPSEALSLGTDESTLADSHHPLANTGKTIRVEDGPWKLVVTYGKTIKYELFNTETDPDETIDLSANLEQIVFRLRGELERREAVEYRGELTKP